MRSLPIPGGIGRAPFAMPPPATGPTCESVRVPSPDNRCVAYFSQTHGEGRNAQASAKIECSWEAGGFQEEIIRLFVDRPIPLRWVNANNLEIGLPSGAHFSPPRESSRFADLAIRYTYRPMSSEPLETLQCFDNQPVDFRKVRLLNGPEKRNAHAPGWIAYGGEGMCMLVGQSVLPGPVPATVVVNFTKTAVPRLPYGTTELVFVVGPGRAERKIPEIRLSPTDAPLMPQANGPGRGYQLVGAQAERVLQQLANGGTVKMSLDQDDAGPLSIEVSRQEFTTAHGAFVSCLHEQ